MIALFNFFNVGFESATGGWLTTYSDRMGAPSHNWLSPIFLFFLWFVIGRAIAPITLRRLKENQLLMLSLIVTFAGAAGLFFANSYLVLCLAAAVTGLGTSSIFPTNMARFYSVFGAAATRQATPIFILGSIGANVISSSIGFISNQYQDLRWGMIVLPVSTALLIALQIAIMLRPPAKTP
jgi:fucose permease